MISLSILRKALFCCMVLMVLGMLIILPKSTSVWQVLSTQSGHDTERTVKQWPILRACSQQYRHRKLADVCQSVGPYKESTGDSKMMQVVAINHKKRILYCALPKSGSRAWLTYMVNVTDVHPNSSWNIRDRDFMSSVGLDYRRKVPVDEIRTKYANYTKFTVVRHPLQWAVALYFEAIVNVHKYPKEDGSLATLQEFIDNLPKYPLFQRAWNSYEAHCHHCSVDYDFLIKAETVSEDGKGLGAVINTDALPQVKHVNEAVTNGGGARNFKYDRFLRELGTNHSETLYKLLALYDKEMSMFGYQWDAKSMVSHCINHDEQGSCC